MLMIMRKSKVMVLLSVIVAVALVSSFVVSVFASENTSTIGKHREELRRLIWEFRETVIRPAVADYLGVDVDSLADQGLRDIVCSLSEDDRSALREILQPLRQAFREEILKPALEGWGVKPSAFKRGIRFRKGHPRSFGTSD